MNLVTKMSAPYLISVIYRSVSIFSGIATIITNLKDFLTVNSQNDTINEVLFYGSEDDERKKQVGLNNLFCIYYLIVHANKTLDVCVPTLDSETISKCLINVHKKNNTKVRIIVHNSDDLNIFQEFLDCNIEIKVIKPEVKLEHEFLLIDANCQDSVAIIGSLDYEVNRVNCNRDNTLLTSEETLIITLKREFERIWTSNNVDLLCLSGDINKL